MRTPVLVLALLGALVLAAPAQATSRLCLTVSDSATGSRAKVYADGAPCKTAGRVFRAWQRAGTASRPKTRPLPGWRCRAAGRPNSGDVDSVRCAKRRATVQWTYSYARAAAAAKQPAPGFEVDLGRTTVECFSRRGNLNCLLYGGGTLPPGAKCDFGGAVPTVVMRRAGRAVNTYSCVDEAFHDWRKMRVNGAFHHGPFGCRHRRVRSARQLKCANQDRSFTVFGTGRVTRG